MNMFIVLLVLILFGLIGLLFQQTPCNYEKFEEDPKPPKKDYSWIFILFILVVIVVVGVSSLKITSADSVQRQMVDDSYKQARRRSRYLASLPFI